MQSSNPRRLRKLLLSFAVVAPFLALGLSGTNLLLALAPLFLSHLLLLYATLVPNCQWWGPVITSFQTSQREVWITIDDGPSPTQTRKILEILQRFDARATFFVIGINAARYPHSITEILSGGHEIANHTYSHPSWSFWAAGPSRTAAEIDRCAEELRARPERPALAFRAPAGLKNPFVHPALARRGMMLVGWKARGLDTLRRDPEDVAEQIVRRVTPGAIVLLHEGYRLESDPDFNPRCLELTLQRLSADGYKFVIPHPDQLAACDNTK